MNDLIFYKDGGMYDGHVQVIHTRKHDDAGAVLPKGGTTYVRITLDSGESFFAHAKCSKWDNFSRKLGRTIAVGRAKKKAKKAGYIEVEIIPITQSRTVELLTLLDEVIVPVTR